MIVIRRDWCENHGIGSRFYLGFSRHNCTLVNTLEGGKGHMRSEMSDIYTAEPELHLILCVEFDTRPLSYPQD